MNVIERSRPVEGRGRRQLGVAHAQPDADAAHHGREPGARVERTSSSKYYVVYLVSSGLVQILFAFSEFSPGFSQLEQCLPT